MLRINRKWYTNMATGNVATGNNMTSHEDETCQILPSFNIDSIQGDVRVLFSLKINGQCVLPYDRHLLVLGDIGAETTNSFTIGVLAFFQNRHFWTQTKATPFAGTWQFASFVFLLLAINQASYAGK